MPVESTAFYQTMSFEEEESVLYHSVLLYCILWSLQISVDVLIS